MQTLSEKGADFIKESEGFKKQPYYCSASVLTVFWGHTKCASEYVNNTLSDADARRIGDLLFRQDVGRFEEQVRRLVKAPLTDPQFDALVSFAYNLGGGALESSTLLKKLNKGDYKGAAKQFDRWVYADGKKLLGLVTRRAKERAMFERHAGEYAMNPSPINEPLRNRDLPLPQTMRDNLEVKPRPTLTAPEKVAVGSVGVGIVGGAGVIEMATQATPLASALSYLDWRLGALIVVILAIGGMVWWVKSKRG